MKTNHQLLELNADFKYALDLVEKTDRSLFLTGKAGTGKSTFLQLFRRTTKKKTVVLAPTGIAALNVQGQTIHSFFGFPPRVILPKDIKKSSFNRWFKKIEVMVIDEISMVRADMLDAIDRSLQIHRENPLPFGGVQMIFIGDLFQLPPVVSSVEERAMLEARYDSPYFFSANAMQQVDMELMELQKVYRQGNRHFLRLLDAVRLNQVDWEDLEDLNSRYQPNFVPPKSYITLSPYNKVVDRINQRQLANLPAPEYIFTATVEGSFDPRLYPTDFALRLKEGAQVMFIKNDVEEGQFVNGTIGEVTKLTHQTVVVETEEGGIKKTIHVEPATWEVLKYRPNNDNPEELETEVLGTFTQYPLKLAWAVTIHKAQGKTFDKVVIDMGRGAFEYGQAYVALSRCRTLEGIVLHQKLRPEDIKVDERILNFYETHVLR